MSDNKASTTNARKLPKLDAVERLIAQRLVRERRASPEIIAAAFGITACYARRLARKALSNSPEAA